MADNYIERQYAAYLEKKAAAEKVQQYRKDKPEEFNNKICNFFADSLDLRYKAFKDGKLTAEAVRPAAPETK